MVMAGEAEPAGLALIGDLEIAPEQAAFAAAGAAAAKAGVDYTSGARYLIRPERRNRPTSKC